MQGVEPGRAVARDLDLEIIRPGQAKLCPSGKPGLEQKGAGVGGGGLVDLDLMPSPRVLEEAGRGVDRQAVCGIGGRAA